MMRKICASADILSHVIFHEVTNGKRFASQLSNLRGDVAEAFTVTCKIHRQAIGEGRVTFCVSGRLTGDHVNTLRTLLEEESSALTLDLKDVRLVDGEAVKLLAIQESNGVRIDNCPLYIREWISRERHLDASAREA